MAILNTTSAVKLISDTDIRSLFVLLTEDDLSSDGQLNVVHGLDLVAVDDGPVGAVDVNHQHLVALWGPGW